MAEPTRPHARWTRGELCVSCDPAELDLERVTAELAASYWAPGIPREVVAASIAGSLCFGLYRSGRQIGFARVVTDRATFAWLGDVFVASEERGQGLGVWLMECVMAHPELQGLRRWSLATRDAHGLYARFGFRPQARPETWMEKHDPGAYLRREG